MTQSSNHQAVVTTSAYDEARHRIAELTTPSGMVLGDVIARLVLDSGAVKPESADLRSNVESAVRALRAAVHASWHGTCPRAELAALLSECVDEHIARLQTALTDYSPSESA